MIIINSAAYVVPEFQSELGEIPPCMLPLGNRKLIQYQVENLRKFKNERIVLSLPLSYKVSIAESKLFEDLDIEVITIPDNFSLVNALIYVINVSVCLDDYIRILHGDTLIYDLPNELDRISVAYTSDEYKWKTVSQDKNDTIDLVWSGFFSFSDRKTLLKVLSLSNGNFVNAIIRYQHLKNSKEIECYEWHDLGHVNTYFVSRSFITTQRAFNSLKISDGVVYKTGIPYLKIKAEAEWFENIPPIVKKYTPQLISTGINESNQPFYSLEYLPHLPMNEIFVHGRNSIIFWSRQFNLFLKYFEDSRKAVDVKIINTLSKKISKDAESLYSLKTYSRLKEFKNSEFLNHEVSVNAQKISVENIVDECIHRTLKLPLVPSVLHGDFCFSNILYDSRAKKIKVIDPRGINYNSEMTIYGDQKYDFAKLTHSILGLYDFIISGRYEIKNYDDGSEYISFDIDERLENIQKKFLEYQFVDGVGVKDIIPLVVLLFFSMLPLHKDRLDRQKAMLLNAFRLYEMID
ncbi:glycosyltransferase family protein [Acinetobacter sp. GXMZU3951]